MNRPEQFDVTFSIVSHGHGAMVDALLRDLAALPMAGLSAEVMLTRNVAEREAPAPLPGGLRLSVVDNQWPLGFGANHNKAFRRAMGRFFVVLNPDLRIPALELTALLRTLDDATVGAVAPLVRSSQGEVQDSARRFPTFWSLARRVLTGDRSPVYRFGEVPLAVDWVAGMFIAFRREVFAEVGGFDERYFMYLEDADICRRLRASGYSIKMCPGQTVIHDARRASHRDLRHLRWHLTSALRFLISRPRRPARAA